MGAKLTLKDCITVAKERGGKCLSNEYVGIKTKMRWSCEKGHEWVTGLDQIRQGHWCPDCANESARLSIEDAQRVAKERGGKCLSNEYVNNRTKMRWRCEKWHEWDAAFRYIKQGRWCPDCGAGQRISIEDAQRASKERGGECLSTEYINNKTKMRWRCEEGHEWKTRLTTIKEGHWCPYCAGQRISIEDAQRAAKERGGKCLSNEYVNNKTKMYWRCEKGHEWDATFDAVNRQGTWCPDCSSGKTQRRLFKIVSEIFKNHDIEYNYRGFAWLKSSKGARQEIDIYVTGVKLAIEYDGKQHYQPVQFGGRSLKEAKAALEKTQQMDKNKDKKIKAHPEDVKHFVRFSYKEPITKEYVVSKLKEVGVIA